MKKNEKVIFQNIDKKKIDKIEEDCKYVILTSGSYEEVDVSEFKIKPIVLAYNGSYGIDLENNKVIINESIKQNELKLVYNYFDNHDIKYKAMKKNNNIYTVKFISDNFYRMLIIPTYFKEKYKYFKTLYQYPYKLNNKYLNYLISNNISKISNLSTIINYLGITTINILDLEVLSVKIVDNLDELGYFIYTSKVDSNVNTINY